MAIQTRDWVCMPAPEFTGVSAGTMSLTGTADSLVIVFTVPKTGNMNKIGIRTGTVTTPQPLYVAFETVSAANGQNTGTLYGGSSSGAIASPTTNTLHEVTLATPASAVAGDDVAVVVKFSGSAGSLLLSVYAGRTQGYPYSIFNAAGVYTKQTSAPILVVGYDDGTYADVGTVPFSTIPTSTSFNSGSSPDERALRFRLNVPIRIIGYWAIMTPAAGSNWDAVLYDTDGTTVLATNSTDADKVAAASNIRFYRRFSSEVNLRANVWYRLALKPTTTTSIGNPSFSVSAAGHMDCFECGQDFHLSTRTDAGAWTDTATTRPLIGLLVSGFHDGTGLREYGMAGGFSG